MIEQTIIAIAGLLSVWLSQDARDSRRKWACIIGLGAAPLWTWVTWQAQQWPLLVLSLVYAIGWARGVRTYWMAA